MGRRPCCVKEGLNRGAWTAMEDKILRDYIKVHGEGKWRNLPKRAGLKRCGKSCRLRWLNYLRPDIKRGNITRDEEDLIIRLHKLLGNRWSLIAGRLPGRTDNEIKNYWNTNIGKKVQSGLPISTPNCKSSNQSKETASPTFDKSIGRPPSPTISPCVVRTKASRCTKVFITTEPPKTQQLEIKPVVETSINEDIVNCTSVGAKSDGDGDVGVSPFTSREQNPSDFLMDFEMDENFLTDFLNNEFGPLCDQLGGGVLGDTFTNMCNTGECSSPNSEQTVFLSQEMLPGSDLGSMGSLLDPEIDWLQDNVEKENCQNLV